MAEPMKNMLSYDELNTFAMAVKAVYDEFKAAEFLKSTMDDSWDDLELKARGYKVVTTLGEFLPPDYKAAIGIIDKAILNYDGFVLFCIPEFVEVYGQDEKNWDISIAAMENYTKRSSSEFTVRPFIIKNEERMMRQMYAWSKSECEHLRRLSSEGCRPALPWAIGLPKFKSDPTPVLPILEQLKTDESLYVRKSVANNLNDISKTHPELVASIAKEWFGKDKKTDWIVKHGCRTLLKQGNRNVLSIFGFGDANAVDVSDFVVAEKVISIGEDITFSFVVLAKADTKVRLEYGIDYMKANGKQNRKIFQISEMSMIKNQKKNYSKKHSFADVSVRKHYPGNHSVTLIVNGLERGTLDFELTSK